MNSPERMDRSRVLVVDDDHVVRMLAGETLRRADFEVAEAADGEAGLALFRDAQPELIMLDVDMPGMDGFEVCRRLRRMEGGERVPVVMVTGMDDLESINLAYDSGATDFVSKPINWPALGHRVRYVLRAARAAEALLAAEERAAATLRAMPDMMFTLDAEGRYLDVKEGIGIAPFIAPGQFMGRSIREILPAEVSGHLREAIGAALATGDLQSLICSSPDPSGVRHYESRIARCAHDKVVAVMRDVTDQRSSEERIRRMAYFDSLTGLPNRQAFGERPERALRHAREADTRVAVLFLDLDGFKRINDTLGHGAGDHLLQSVANRLRHGLRGDDTVAGPAGTDPAPDFARLGGDEFTVTLSAIRDLKVIEHVADRIRTVIGQPFVILGEEVVVTASIGIAVFPDDGPDAATLLKHADTAMYHAKDAGRNNRQSYSASLTTRALERLELERRLRRAVEHGELSLQYQPQIEAATGRVAAVEALVRWNDPDLGLVMPGDFIQVAEETGLIVPIGSWVLAESCLQAKRWREAGIGALRVAVNISARQLRDPEFADSVLAVLDSTGVEARMVELELTESILMDSDQTTVDQLRRLGDEGIRFAIDDFGTGYSSMSYLKRFPVTVLKIDRSFVSGLPADADDAAICRAILSMAHSLGLQVVAEGIQTDAQAEFLRGRHCEFLQGYLFGRPLPARAIEGMLRGHARCAAAAGV